MSKKRKRRLKKLAKVLGAGLAIAGLGRAFANRNARASTNADAVKAMTSDPAYKIPGGDERSFKIQEVKIETPKQKPTKSVNLSRMTGSGPSKGEIGQDIRANYARRMRNMAADKNRNDMLRAIRSNVDVATTPDSIIEGVPLPDYMISARKGGRIVKGKKTAVRTGAAKRGFGRAFKGGK